MSGTQPQVPDSTRDLHPSGPSHRHGSGALQAYLLAAAAAFAILAVTARTVNYFPIDLTITRFVQSYHAAWFERLMFAISWLGFMPQVNVIVLGLALALQLARLRREALCVLIAAAGLAVAGLIKLIIARPRPSPDLVHVLRTLSSSGFPSGHVLETTAVCGYLAYVAWQLLKPSLGRSALITALGVLIALMGVSRIQQGQHWFSDVCGAYLLGSLWLSFTIRIHQRGRPVTAPSSRP